MRGSDPYSGASDVEASHFKLVKLPFHPWTSFVVSQAPFGKASHAEKGNEYQWDFDVPYGTPVVAVEDGVVIEVWEPKKQGGCEPKFGQDAHNIKVKHVDGTVAQYVHIEARVKENQAVKSGEVIALTAMNGWICRPQLHFGVYRSDKKLYQSPERESIPLRFEGVAGGLAVDGTRR